MEHEPVLHCWNCGVAQAGVPFPPSRHDYCGACGEALHCCRQCTLFARAEPGQCREPRADPPTDRETANFCEWFAPAVGGGAADRSAAVNRSAADAARAKLDALFGDPE